MSELLLWTEQRFTQPGLRAVRCVRHTRLPITRRWVPLANLEWADRMHKWKWGGFWRGTAWI